MDEWNFLANSINLMNLNECFHARQNDFLLY